MCIAIKSPFLLAFLLGISFVHLLLNYFHDALPVIQHLRGKRRPIKFRNRLKIYQRQTIVSRQCLFSRGWPEKFHSDDVLISFCDWLLLGSESSRGKKKTNQIRSITLTKAWISSPMSRFNPSKHPCPNVDRNCMFPLTLTIDFLESPSCSTTSCDLCMLPCKKEKLKRFMIK